MSAFLRLFARPATYRVLIWVLAACGVSLSPEQAEAISAAGVAVAVALEVLFRDKPRDPTLRTREADALPIAMQGQARGDSAAAVSDVDGCERASAGFQSQ